MPDPAFIVRIESELDAPVTAASEATPETVAAAVKTTLGAHFAGLMSCGVHPMRYVDTRRVVAAMNAEFRIVAPTRLRAASLAFKVSDRIQELIGPTTIWQLTVHPDGRKPV